MTAPTLTEFLLARIAETEERVRAGAPGTLTSFYGWHTVDCGTGLGYWANEECTCRYVDHVLADCDAKRRMVEDHNTVHAGCPGSPTLTSDDGEQQGSYGGPCAVLRNLGSVYADHPDYDEAWRP